MAWDSSTFFRLLLPRPGHVRRVGGSKVRLINCLSDSRIDLVSSAILLLALGRFGELSLPPGVGLRRVDVRVHKVEHVVVPVYRTTFDALFDVLRVIILAIVPNVIGAMGR